MHFYLSNNICLCITNYLLQTNQCILSVNCLSNQYYNSSQNLCLGCNALCKTCTNDTDCTDCISTFVLSNYKCICNLNSYYNISTISCISCINTLIGCLTCQNSTYCLTCDTSLHFYLSNNMFLRIKFKWNCRFTNETLFWCLKTIYHKYPYIMVNFYYGLFFLWLKFKF